MPAQPDGQPVDKAVELSVGNLPFFKYDRNFVRVSLGGAFQHPP
jgi:hypothetical protein